MIYSPQQLKAMDAGDIAQCSPRHIMSVVEDLISTALEAEQKMIALHQHINHLRSAIYPPKMSDSAAWRMVPVKHAMNVLALIDPPPMTVNRRTLVFANPMAAEILTRLSAEVRAMFDAVPPSLPEAK